MTPDSIQASSGGFDFRVLPEVETADILSSVLNDNVDGILLVDRGGVILTANPAAGRLFGRSSELLVGERFGHAMSTSESTEIEFVTRPGRVAEMRCSETVLGGRPVSLVMLRDITETKEAEDALRNFISVASHEFRSPITSIAGFAETMLEQWEQLDDEAKRRFVEVIDRQAGHLSRLVTNLLSLSWIEGERATNRTPTTVRDAVLLAVEVVGDMAEDVELDVPDHLRVLVDPDHLVEMLVNYIGNALKYGRHPIRVTSTDRGRDVDVVVLDRGPGVPPRFVPKLFQQFSRDRGTEHSQPGSGLGLSIVAGLARRNHGSAWYRPDPEGGSRFGLTLPAA